MYLVCRLLLLPPPRSPLFPYTTLFRSSTSTPPCWRSALSSGDDRRVGLVPRVDAADTVEELGVFGDLPIARPEQVPVRDVVQVRENLEADRKSTRLNSSHRCISYAVFCYCPHRDLPSFPTRRSSDLRQVRRPAGGAR